MGYAIYCGHNTKAFKNARKPPSKMSNVLKKMNKILYSVKLILFFKIKKKYYLGFCFRRNFMFNLHNS